MSIKLMTRVWGLSMPTTQKLILLALADWAHDSGLCWPAVNTLAAKASVGRSTAFRTLRDFAEAGILRTKKRRNSSSLYVLDVERAAEIYPPAMVDEGELDLAEVGPATGRGGGPDAGLRGPAAGLGGPDAGLRGPASGPKPLEPSTEPSFTLMPSDPSRQQPAPWEEIYKIYPRKVGKPAAIKAIRTALKTTPAEVLLAATKRYAAHVMTWPIQDRQYIPYAGTWFHQRRWEDEETFQSRGGGGRPAGYNAPGSKLEDPGKF